MLDTRTVVNSGWDGLRVHLTLILPSSQFGNWKSLSEPAIGQIQEQCLTLHRVISLTLRYR
jgi:hypothetical protein